MDQVKIRAVVAAGGLPKGREVTVAATPMVEGAISNGVFLELERYPSALVDELADETLDDVTPVPPIQDVELPESGPMDVPLLDEPKTPQAKARRSRG